MSEKATKYKVMMPTDELKQGYEADNILARASLKVQISEINEALKHDIFRDAERRNAISQLKGEYREERELARQLFDGQMEFLNQGFDPKAFSLDPNPVSSPDLLR